MVDSVTQSIKSGATSVLWDNAIDKKSIIQASKHINDISATINSMFKVLRQNLSMTQSLIEEDIMFNALHKITKELENLYINQTSL